MLEVLTTKDLIIRPFTPEDVQIVLAVESRTVCFIGHIGLSPRGYALSGQIEKMQKI